MSKGYLDPSQKVLHESGSEIRFARTTPLAHELFMHPAAYYLHAYNAEPTKIRMEITLVIIH